MEAKIRCASGQTRDRASTFDLCSLWGIYRRAGEMSRLPNKTEAPKNQGFYHHGISSKHNIGPDIAARASLGRSRSSRLIGVTPLHQGSFNVE